MEHHTKEKQYWLVKSEPSAYSIDDLKREKKTAWTGVRNYQARNFMRDEMKVADTVLFYHSSSDEVGVTGLAKVASPAYPDPTQYQKKSHYYDPKATKELPRWQLVDIAFVKKFSRIVTLAEMRRENSLRNMWILRPGSRLSITPVSQKEFEVIFRLAQSTADSVQ